MRLKLTIPVAFLTVCAMASDAQSAPAGAAQAQGMPVNSQTAYPSSELPNGTRFFSLEHRAQGRLDEADARIFEQRRSEIAREARFYLFNIDSGVWTWEQVMCPEIPGQILLQYSSAQADGKESRFSVLVPRGSGRVRVVPVLYRSGSPFGVAISNPHNIQLFNAAVPADVAREGVAEDGHWLSLASCYVELTSGHSHIPIEPPTSLELAQAPDPTLIVQPKYSQVVFADRREEKRFVIWSVTLNKDGRVMTAGMERHDPAKVTIVPAEQPLVTKKVPDEK